MAKDLKVTVIGDASSYSRALKQASGETHSFGKSLLTLGKFAALGLGAAGVGGALVTLKRGFDELKESQQVAAQTGAVLKSTGNAAHTSAKQVDAMATSISNMSGIDDEAVQAGENMLLTFTNIRNETGKNNNIFDQATKTLGDFATAMNRGAAPSAEQLSKNAILLGKALNDPIKGISALRRVGVAFTDDQKKQIEALVKSGKTMDAQKLILRELNKEFGGSAAAAGKTLPGQLNIAKNSFDNLAGSIAAKLLPTINQVLTWINSHWPQISAVFNAVADGVGAAINAIVIAVKAVIPVVQQVVAWVQQNWPQISAIFTEAFNRVAPVVIATFNTIKAIILGTITTIRFIWEHFGAQITAVTVAVFGYIKTTIENVMNVIRGIVNVIGGLIHGDWARVWQGIQQIFGGFVGQITGAVKLFGSLLVAELQTAGKLMLLAISGPVHAIVGVIQSAVGAVTSAAKAVGEGIVGGIRAGLAGITAAVKGGLDRIWGIISNVASLVYNAAKAIPAELVHGIVDGLKGLVGTVKGAVTKYITDPIGGALHSIPGFSPPVDAGRWLGNELVRGIVESLKHGQGVVAAATSGITDSVGKSALKGMNNVGQLIVNAAKKYGIDAKAALAVAMGEGGIKFGGPAGDSGQSFGPFQMATFGELSGKTAAEARKFADSIEGINFALKRMAEVGAAGKTGFDAIKTIIEKFEKPLHPDASIAAAVERYKNLGPQIATAVASGTGAIKTTIAQTLEGLVALVKQYGPQIGVEHVRGIIAGLVGKTPDIVAAAKAQMEKVVAAMALVAQTKTDLKSAFQSMAQGALAAFDEVASKWVPPSMKKLTQMQKEDTINAAVKQVSDAQAAVDAAIAAQANLAQKEGESDADFAARVEEAKRNVQTAVEAVGAAQRSYEETQLQLQAEQEQKAHDIQVAADREHLAERLTVLQTELAKHPEEYAKIQRQILKLLKTYHVPLYTAGQKLAQAFSDGLDDGIASVIATAKKLAAALEAVVQASGGGGGAGAAVTPATAIGGGHGAGVPNSFSGGRASAGSVNVYVAGDVLSEDQLLTKVRTGLDRYATNNALGAT